MSEQKALANYDEQLAALGKEYASNERAAGEFLSTKGGILQYGDEVLPGNQAAVIILDVVGERTYYASKYDAKSEHNLPPVCYAFWRPNDDPDTIEPHRSMEADPDYFIPQNDICKTCEHNEWGTADTGRGKACAERRRMAVLPAGIYTPRGRGSKDFDLELIDDAQHYADMDFAFLKLNVMSVKNYARYVTNLASQHNRPPFGVITRIYLEPDPKSQFQIKFELLESIPSELLPTIFERHEEAKSRIIFGYPPPSPEAQQQASRGRSARR